VKSDEIIENTFISNLVKNFPRARLQHNSLQESDAELIKIPGTDEAIAITTDSIVEEIERGLYSDPYLIGWMTVIVNASDIAAVGAEPLGILLNETFPSNIDPEFLENLQKGIKDACCACNLNVLGGDTNFSSHLQMGACALGLIHGNKLLMRSGCKPGDFLFTSGKLGKGNSYAFYKLILSNNSLINLPYYQPKPRLEEGKILREFASCCMDTSDGMIATIDQLMRLNNIGFNITTCMDEWIHPEVKEFSLQAKIPLWWMLAGPHGEFELLFTIPPEQIKAFVETASCNNWKPVMLGQAFEDAGLQILLDDKSVMIDTGKIRNLFDEVNGDLVRYIKNLEMIDYQFKNQ